MSGLVLKIEPRRGLPEDRVEYNQSSGVLTVYVGNVRPVPRSVVIDTLVLDIDDNGEIWCMELIWRKQRWARVKSLKPPRTVFDGRVVFSQTLRNGHVEVDADSQVFSDPTGQTIYFQAQRCDGGGRRIAVRVSESVVADTLDEELCGFWISGIP